MFSNNEKETLGWGQKFKIKQLGNNTGLYISKYQICEGDKFKIFLRKVCRVHQHIQRQFLGSGQECMRKLGGWVASQVKVVRFCEAVETLNFR